MSTKTPIAAVLITSASLAGAGTSRATYDCRDIDVGIITARITNGGSPPGAPCQFNIYVAHTTGATPAAAAEGTGDTDWKRVYARAGDITANSSYRFTHNIGPYVNHIMVEISGHTTNAVKLEAHLSAASY
jgi:hypothetical protein